MRINAGRCARASRYFLRVSAPTANCVRSNSASQDASRLRLGLCMVALGVLEKSRALNGVQISIGRSDPLRSITWTGEGNSIPFTAIFSHLGSSPRPRTPRPPVGSRVLKSGQGGTLAPLFHSRDIKNLGSNPFNFLPVAWGNCLAWVSVVSSVIPPSTGYQPKAVC